MSFTAKLHIQGVGCYAPLFGDRDETAPPPYTEAKRLLVVFPDGRPGLHTPPNLCLHLNFVQFRGEYATEGLGGYVTQFLDRELLSIDTGKVGGIETLDLGHLPTMEEALPEDSQADLRPIDPRLLAPAAADPEDRVIGKLLVEGGTVTKHPHPRFTGKWYFSSKDQARDMSTVTTVTYSDIDRFSLIFRKLGATEERSIQLGPSARRREVEIWVRNMCDGFPLDETKDFEVLSESQPIDEDFVLNYKVRGNSGPDVLGPVPKVVPEVGGEMHKCMGSV